MVLLAVTSAAQAVAVDAKTFRADLEALTRDPSRAIGSEGYDRAGAYIEKTIRALPNVELKSHAFPVMVPVTEHATLDLGGGRIERVYPFWPAHIRVSATPPEGISGRLVYAGECRYEQLRPASLDGQIAIVEASAGSRWVEAPYLGARAVLILGTAETNWSDLSAHDLRVPVNLPRFYVPPGALADALRAGRLDRATLKATVTWQRRTARNFYALVRGRVQQPAGWTASLPPAALMFSVRFDATSMVPDLAPGASQAVQAASGLALLRDLSQQPWSRPVVVFFSGADGIQNLGTRNMFLALADAPQTWRDEQATLDRQIQAAERDLARARVIADDLGKLSIREDRDLIERTIKIIDTDLALEQDQLFRIRAIPASERTQRQRDQLAPLEARQIALNRLKFVLRQKPSELSDAQRRAAAVEYFQRVIERLGGDPQVEGLLQQYAARKAALSERIALYHWLADAVGREREPDPRRQTATRLIELLVGLDLTDRGQRVGPMFYGFFQRASGMSQILGYRDWFAGVERGFAGKAGGFEWWGALRDVVNIEPLSQGRLPATYLAGPLATPGEIAQAWGVPGLSMITLNDLRLRRDTPTDTLDRLDVDAVLPQLNAVREIFARASDDPRFRGPAELRRLEVDITGQVLGQSPGKPVPDLPRGGFLATYYHAASKDKQIPMLGSIPWSLGVRRNEIRQTDAEGNYLFEGLPRLRADRLEGIEKQQADLQYFDVHVYRLNPASGAIIATTDLGEQAKDVKRVIDIKQDYKPVRSVVFNCEEFTLTRLYDPRFLQTLGEVLPLDARRNAEPQRFNMMMANQMLAGFVEPGTPLHLLIRYGRVGNRLVLLNMGDERRDAGTQRREERDVAAPAADQTRNASFSDLRASASLPSSNSSLPLGYTPRELNNLGPLALVTSRDFYRLDEQRLSDYRRAGVSSTLIDSLHADAREQIDASEQAMRADDGVALIRNATGAWANEARVYNAAQDMARDVIRAAIFLLMLCVPFAFCMERLLIGTPNVYRQIAGITAIFAVMTLALWAFHPAFRISASPLIIILAFAIILMSCVVIFVVYQKFDAELKRIGSGRGGIAPGAASAGTTQFGSASVLMSAVLLGIANMRKRKFRTMLTSLTIVLITFAVLCFTSTTRYVGTAVDATGVATSHPGILLRQRGFRPMPEIVADQLHAVLADPKLDAAKVNIVERWWAVSTSEPNEKYNLVGAEGRTVALPAVLGLSPGESRLSPIAEVIGAERFAALENGATDVVYLAKPTADALGVAQGGTVRLGGIDLIVAGLFDPVAFDRDVLTLSGEPIAPLKYISGQLDAGGRKLDDTESESLELGGGGGDLGGTYEHLPSTDFAIVPARVAQTLYKSTLRSVGFRLEDEKQVKRVSDELTRRFSLAQFAGYDDGVRMVSASNLSSVSGAAEVAIPLMIAGLIIFNTMMGSIAERKREIHVYTSLGLAPLHVGALFVAEAMTYGLIGAVFGYVIGQGAGALLLKLGWLGSVTLNYSGTSAMVTMGLILFIVLLSALIPARLASKIAAPSIDRNWKVPAPRDGVITAQLPFTINKTAADGALAYLAEWFDDHREGSIGKFASGRIEPFAAADARSHGLRTSIWLTPFDLGVRQQLELLIHPGVFPDIYEVQVKLMRQSGDDASWHRMNRPFLTELRKQFLRWRSLSPARMTEYVERSRAMAFARDAALETTATS